jgi:Zn finger protein HypA/HybF involved in hydrogenase expression
MALVSRLKGIVGGESAPNQYECPECDRTFEVDAPPERVICSGCGNKDVRLAEGG